MTTSNQNIQGSHPKGLELKLEQLLKGLQTTLPTGSSVLLGGTSVPQPQLISEVQSALAPFLELRKEKLAYQAKVKAKADSLTATRELIAKVRIGLIAALGAKSPLLAQFGINPSKRKVLTAAQKVLAAAKRKVTRQLRGTTSAKQKLALKATGIPAVALDGNGLQVTPAAQDAVGARSGTPPTPTPQAAPPAQPAAPAAPAVSPTPAK